MMTPANDTAAPTTIALGTTAEGAAWRAHRYSTHIELTSLANAGRRGKVCLVLAVRGNAERIDLVAPFVLSALDVPEETMLAALEIAELGMTIDKGEARGVDVPREPTIALRADLVDGTFTTRDSVVRHTTDHGKGHRQDTISGACSPKDAAKAYRWVAANREAFLRMNRVQFMAEMGVIGARFS
jgi:hypothetical protein